MVSYFREIDLFGGLTGLDNSKMKSSNGGEYEAMDALERYIAEVIRLEYIIGLSSLVQSTMELKIPMRQELYLAIHNGLDGFTTDNIIGEHE